MTQINKLELKYYDNISRFLKTIDLDSPNIFKIERDRNRLSIYRSPNTWIEAHNFYEYYIDGEALMDKIAYHFWDAPRGSGYGSGIFDTHIGWFGTFQDISWNWVIAKVFFMDKISDEDLKQYCSHIDTLSEKKAYMESIRDELSTDYPLVYGCPCHDEGCGGFEVKLSKKDSYYIWTFEGESPLQFRFEENQYRTAFQKCLEEIKATEIKLN